MPRKKVLPEFYLFLRRVHCSWGVEEQERKSETSVDYLPTPSITQVSFVCT